MLKIKDNVDLKELEKYGFKKFNKTSIWEEHYCFSYVGCTLINIENNNRKIKLRTSQYTIIEVYKMSNTLYDLIQDGLVEKVEDK